MPRHTGNINQLLFEKTLQAEVLRVEKDMLFCTFQNPIMLIEAGCTECDGEDGHRYEDVKIHGVKYLEAVEKEVNGVVQRIDPKQACYEDHNCVDPITKSALRPMLLHILKPYSLRTTPFDGKAIKYNEGASDEFSVTYKYSDSGRQRTATYSKKTPRCARGAHEEVIWPPYRERVGFENTEGFTPGDTIRYMENVISPEIDKVDTEPSTDPPGAATRLVSPQNPGAEALFNLDINLDGRVWADDCGGGGGGGGGSVWV